MYVDVPDNYTIKNNMFFRSTNFYKDQQDGWPAYSVVMKWWKHDDVLKVIVKYLSVK